MRRVFKAIGEGAEQRSEAVRADGIGETQEVGSGTGLAAHRRASESSCLVTESGDGGK
jgi:hypothetical protein